MVLTTISQTFTDNTVSNLVVSMAVAFVIVLVALVIMVIIMKNYKKREDAKQFYLMNVIAFKVGLIHKKAEEAKIELKYPPNSDIVTALEEEVSKDLSKVNP